MTPHKPAKAVTARSGAVVNHTIRARIATIQSHGRVRSGPPVTRVTAKRLQSEGQGDAVLLDIVNAGGKLKGGHAAGGAGNRAEGDVTGRKHARLTERGMGDRSLQGAGRGRLDGLGVRRRGRPELKAGGRAA